MSVQTTGRPTLYKGILMRSRLEADFAGFMDKVDWEWEYEPIVFAGPSGQWLPDFLITRVRGEVEAPRMYVDVKPGGWLDDHDPAELLVRMENVWLSEPGAFLQVMEWSYGTGASPRGLCGWREDHWYEPVYTPGGGWQRIPWQQHEVDS